MKMNIKKQNIIYLNDIFYSIQGEGSQTGKPCIFIRLGLCNLNCSYCDTKTAKSDYKIMTISQIINCIKNFCCKNVCITGGEPLLQKNVFLLMKYLLNKKYKISIETNGCNDISSIDKKVHIIMDIKCPSSKETNKNLYENLNYLKSDDDIKFVISNKNDYIWARKLITKKNLTKYFNVFLSPVYNKLNPRTLATWILKDGLDVKLQIQLHKYLGLK